MSAKRDSFPHWLNQQLADRGWSFRELSRRSGVSTTHISELANSKRGPGLDACLSIARAFNLPPEKVLRLAGLLPPLPAPVQEEKEALTLLRTLPASTRTIALDLLRTLAGAQPARTLTDPPDSYTPDPLTTELLDTFRQLPVQWQQEAVREIERLQRYAALQVRYIGDDNEQTGAA